MVSFPYKTDFSLLEWERPIEGVRHKCFERDGMRLRLVEYSQKMPLHWCEKGHLGYVLKGKLDIAYENSSVTYQAGDGIFIPDGPEHRHRGRVSSGKALVFFVEKV